MIKALLILTAASTLAAAHHVPVPTITKEVDGTKIDINVNVDIDTGGNLIARSKTPATPVTQPTVPSTVEPPACAAEGQQCNFKYYIGPGSEEEKPPETLCCGDMKCGYLPGEGQKCVKASSCQAENEGCRFGVRDACCQGLYCTSRLIGGFGLPGYCLRRLTGTEKCIPEHHYCKEDKPCCGGLACEDFQDRSTCQEKTGSGKISTMSPNLSTKPTQGQCQTAGQPCQPGTESRESSLVCCPNHLCDLDHKICRRVAFKSLPGK